MQLKEGTPRHTQISNWIRSQIDEGVFQIDEKLPSENELCKKFDVSRVTVRKALQTLQNENIIYKYQGLGSFVADNRSHQSLIRLTDFVEDMTRAGMTASSKVIRLEQVPVPSQVAGILKVKENTTVIRLDRLRLGDGQPIAFDITWLPMMYGQLLEDYDLKEKTIYTILEEDYEIPVQRGRYSFEARNAESYIAENLNIQEGSAVQLIDRLSVTLGDKPIYYQKRYYRSDRVVYELLLERDENDKTGSGEMPLREFVPVFRTE